MFVVLRILTPLSNACRHASELTRATTLCALVEFVAEKGSREIVHVDLCRFLRPPHQERHRRRPRQGARLGRFRRRRHHPEQVGQGCEGSRWREGYRRLLLPRRIHDLLRRWRRRGRLQPGVERVGPHGSRRHRHLPARARQEREPGRGHRLQAGQRAVRRRSVEVGRAHLGVRRRRRRRLRVLLRLRRRRLLRRAVLLAPRAGQRTIAHPAPGFSWGRVGGGVLKHSS